MNKGIEFCSDVSEEFRREVDDFVTEWESQNDFIEVQTSGSTGLPKTIRVPKHNAQISAKKTADFFGLGPQSSLLLCLSAKHIAGKMMIVRAMECGGKLIVTSPTANPMLNTEGKRFDFAAFVPYQVSAILSAEKSSAEYQRIGSVIIGGATLSLETEKKLPDFSNRQYATFGMTETVSHFALRNLGAKEEQYTCLPGFEIEVDLHGRLILSKHPFSEEPFVSNDIVEVLDQQRFKWLGRCDNVINSGAVKIHPESIERLIEPLMNGVRFYVSSIPHPDFGQTALLVVEGESLVGWRELRRKMTEILPAFHCPRGYRTIPKFDETETGKVIRQKF